MNGIPTKLISEPLRKSVTGKKITMYETDEGPFSLPDLVKKLAEHGIEINGRTLYSRIFKYWQHPDLFNPEFFANTSCSGRRRRDTIGRHRRKIESIKIGTWEARQK